MSEHTKSKDAQTAHAKLQARHAHSQAATLAQDALQLELSEMRLDTGCVAFLVAFKNRVMELENLRDQGNPVTDNEGRTWLSRLLLMHSEMNRAFGNLESNEMLLASALPSVAGSAPPSKLSFPELCKCTLDQAHKIDAAVMQTSKESLDALTKLKRQLEAADEAEALWARFWSRTW